MAKASVTTKQSLTAKGILSLGDNDILLEIEDGEAISLIDLFKDFDGKSITVAVSYGEEVM
jgi:hypothetical protein